MFYIIIKIPVKCIHKALMPCESFKSNWINNIGSILCHDHVDVTVKLNEHTREIRHFVCRDTSCHSKHYRLSL